MKPLSRTKALQKNNNNARQKEYEKLAAHHKEKLRQYQWIIRV